MVEIAISVAAKVVEYLVAPIARPFGYIWNYKTNFDNLKTEVRKLECQRDTVQHSIGEAIRNGEQIELHVNDWMDRVNMMTDEALEVIEENQRANMKCFKGLCPNPKKHYQHSRKAVKKANAIVGLYADGNFQTVSFRTIPEETWIPSYKDYMVFESRMSTLKNILDALSNPDVNMVGIYGTGGIGKTTLAREIAGHAEDKKLFNVVAFAEVAVKPDIKEIQHEIADKLGLTFHDESLSGRARSLQQRLKREEKVLLVLDNIWERLNLEDVGIPFGSDHKGCKLLLTARNLDVLSKMDSQRNFVVGFLDKGEAWSLFEKKAGSCDHLQALAKNVAEACGGLPVAIDSVAVALKNKEEFEWKDALRKLKTPSAGNFEGVAAETYSSIEISYSQLKEEELKSTFLLCCMMEYYTNVGDLLAYGMGLGIFKYVEAMEDARNRVKTLVRKLKDSSLLLDIDNYTFSLHDVVRDVGRSIASRDGHMFTVMNNCIPREWEDKDIRKNCVGISLYNINKLPEEFECPELQFFYVRTTNVPNNFFAGMLKLKVLHLAGLGLNSVPNSIRLLVNLRTLYIYNCELRDVDFIGEFKQLEILRIRGSYCSDIEMIPKKMCYLTGLRFLDLSDCSIRNIPPNVLSTFTRLEELYLPASVLWKRKIELEVEGVNILDELKHLMHLTTLKIGIADANVLPKGCFLLKKLERYDIIIGNNGKSPFYRKRGTSKNVLLNLETSSRSDDVQKFLSVLDGRGFPELEYLHVENSPCFRAIVDCLESESCHHFLSLQSLSLHSVLNLEMIHSYPLKDKADSFRQLRTITVKKCNKLKNILSFSTYRALPLLEVVDVSSCDDMEEIFATIREEEINNNEGIDQIEFKHLRTITVEKCNKLKNILSFSTYRSLPLLQKVYVSTCNNMEEVFAINSREEDINNIEGTDQIEFKHLSSLTLEYLPKLTSFCSINNNKDMLDTPTLLFNQKVVFSNLEALKLCSINFEKIWHNELPAISSCFQCLRQLSIEECSNLKVVFSSSTVAFPSLEELKITEMIDLEMIWPNQLCNDSFCNLKSLEVRKCNELLTIFQSNMVERLTRLEYLTICDCYLVEEIFDLQGVDYEESHPAKETLLRKLDFKGLPKLKHIWNKDPQKMFYKKLSSVNIYDCMRLKYLFPVSIAESLLELKQLCVSHCGAEEIVGGDQGEAKVAATFVFPLITSLDLNNLPRLKTFYCGVHTSQWQNLKSLGMHDCEKVELFVSELFNFQENNEGQHGSSVQPLFIVEKVTFPSLEKIKISESNNLKILWQKGAKESFCSLKSVEVSSCNELLTIFQFNTLEGLSMPKLLTVTISNCASVEEIFDLQKVNFEESHSRAVTYQLQELDIRRLPKLKHIWKKDPQAELSFEDLPMPKLLNVIYCDSIEEVFDLQMLNFEESPSRAVPCRLQELNLERLPKLKHIWKKDPQAKLSFEELPMPESLRVSDCYSIEEIFDLQKVNFEESHSRPVTYRLQELDIRRLPKLKHIWKKDPQVELSFEELPMPESLRVSDCYSIEEIFDLQKVNFEESHSRPVTYRLQELDIRRLPKLKHIWKKDPQAELSFEDLPMPKLLNVIYCDSIEEVFDLQMLKFEESTSRAVPCRLQELNLERLPKLKHVWKKDPQAKLSFEELPMLESLRVSDCYSIEEIFDLQKVNFEESHSRPVTYRLQELDIRRLPKLKHIWKKDPQVELSFEELPMPESLRVSDCYSIEEIFDLQKVNFEESHSRPVTYRLQELDIRRLPKLKHIWKKDPQAELSFEDLPMPKLLNVIYCDSIEEVFDLQMLKFEESPSRAVPCRLQELNLERLPKLKHVWKKDPQAKLSFEELPMLESLRVSDCYSIEEIFDLQKVNFEESHSRPVTYRLQELDIRRLPKLKHIWKKDPQAELSLENLQGVYVSNCQSLKDIFPASIARSLLQLVHLNVYGCVKLEEIIAQEEEAKEAARFVFPKVTSITLSNLPQLRTFYRGVHSSKWEVLKELKVVGCDKIELLASQSPWFQENNIEECNIDISVQPPFFLVEKLVPSSTSFQNLAVLKVWFCNGLKNLMTSSTAKRLVQLREMAIGSCNSMIEVVAKGGDVTEDKIIFSKLRTLTLGYLPSLSCFCSENYTFELPSLEEIIMDTCPEMKYFSLGDITTPILQKVRRGSKNYTLEGDLNTTVQKTQRVHDCWDLEMELYFRTLIFPEF